MSVGLVRPTTDLEFADVVLGAAGPVLVAFHRPPGPPEYLDDLARDLPWLTCVRLDTDAWPRTPAAYRVVDPPVLLVFVGGAPVLAVDAAQRPEVLRSLLTALPHGPGALA